jgi:hypothetical protein
MKNKAQKPTQYTATGSSEIKLSKNIMRFFFSKTKTSVNKPWVALV